MSVQLVSHPINDYRSPAKPGRLRARLAFVEQMLSSLGIIGRL